MKTSQPTTSSSSTSEYWIRTGKQLTASTLAGWTEAFLTYPAEYTKIMLQLQTNGKVSAEGQKKSISAGDVVRSTLRNYGPLGMYRGFSIVFVGSVPKYMCRFGAYEQIKRLLIDPNGQQLSTSQKLICGLGAGVVEALVAVIPIESTKVKFINDRLSETPKYKGLASGVREIVRERGLGAMYSGVTATVVKQASNQAVRFAVFESLKEWSGSKGDTDENSATKKLYPVFGMTAGAASVLINAPIDAVKTRLQSLQSGQYSGTVDCLVKVYQTEGVKAFYRGAGIRMVKCGLEVAIAFTTYNLIMDVIGA